MNTAPHYRAILHAVQEPILVIDRQMRIVEANEAAQKVFSKGSAPLTGCACHRATHGLLQPCSETGLHCPVIEVFETGRFVRAVHRHQRVDGGVVWEEILASPLRNEQGEIVAVVEELRDLTEALQHRSLIKELQAQVRRLEGILPICGHCKKIRNKSGAWEEIEVYVRDRTDADFSHSICPDCLTKHYAAFKA
ncbi:MAG TPA: PAS domain-containing protein [Kiritimatiellia bacterium]|nr:PAS domain-containing protein [Kiritimatiellia bacterium]HSA18914.1 PAS domain-containing protein [Kiritimatiellia bacterium]